MKIEDIPVILSYDILISNNTERKKRISSLKKLPDKIDISALALISKYLRNKSREFI
jgi:hypothetical protein